MNFYSLSLYPGQTGKHYYTSMFSRLGLQHTYTPLGTQDIRSSVLRLKDAGAAGISISMPYKTEVIEMLDFKDVFVDRFNSCNTIKVVNGELHGYNTDYAGVLNTLSLLDGYDKISILGDGAMGTMFKEALGDRAIVYSRKLNTWNRRYHIEGVVINCTGLGTSTTDSPFLTLPNVSLVIDLAIKQNQLEQQCADASVKYVRGIEFYKYQFLKQFEIYTGINLKIEDLVEL